MPLRTAARTPAAVAVATVAVGLACSGMALGHSVVTLGGSAARAGGSGALSLSIQHGCTGGLSTDRVVAWFSRDWRSVRPTGPTGWTPVVDHAAGGDWTITWTASGAPAAFGTPFTLTLRVGWPRTARTYAVPTLQYCGAVGMAWTDPYSGPADANRPSPVDFPVPRIRVRAR